MLSPGLLDGTSCPEVPALLHGGRWCCNLCTSLQTATGYLQKLRQSPMSEKNPGTTTSSTLRLPLPRPRKITRRALEFLPSRSMESSCTCPTRSSMTSMRSGGRLRQRRGFRLVLGTRHGLKLKLCRMCDSLRIAGSQKGISKQPIHLKVYSTEVLNLTLVDLPGLTKVPVGDQPTNIEIQIERLVRDYIEKPNCIILAISPANVDLANSDSLRLARKLDPQGRRTIGVLTKLDLMDAGTNALDILTGRVYPLKLGFIGVVNRSQQDIVTGKPMDEQLENETEFFKNSPAYRSIAHRCGTKYLAKSLNQVHLRRHGVSAEGADNILI